MGIGGGVIQNYLKDLCNAADIDKVTDLDLLVLAEQCATLEEQVYAMLDRLSATDRGILQEYINTRNDLECESLKAALRWGMHGSK